MSKHKIHFRKRKLQSSRIQQYRDFESIMQQHQSKHSGGGQPRSFWTIGIAATALVGVLIFFISKLENNRNQILEAQQEETQVIEQIIEEKLPVDEKVVDFPPVVGNQFVDEKKAAIKKYKNPPTMPGFESKIATYADKSDSTEWVTVVYIDTPAAPKEGYELFYQEYIEKNIHYPSEAKEKNISGQVYVQFVVQKNGKITDVEIMSGLGAGCDQEAMRLMRQSPHWKPAQYKFGNTKQAIAIPITFKP